MYSNLDEITKGFEARAKQAGDQNTWVGILKAKQNEKEDIKLLSKLNQIVGGMPDAEKTKLCKRFSDIIPHSAQKYDREYNDQFLEALVEILGWGWLKEKYLQHTPCFTMGTPDLLVKDNSDQVVAAMECKKIRTSDEDRDYYKNHQGEVKRVKDSLLSDDRNQNPLFRKLKDTLNTAERQVNQSNATDKFIFLDLSFDTPLMFADLKKPVICLLLKFASELCERGITLVSFEQYQMDKLITGSGPP